MVLNRPLAGWVESAAILRPWTATRLLDWIQGRQLAANNLAGCTHHPLQAFLLVLGATTKPHADWRLQDTLHLWVAELDEDLPMQAFFCNGVDVMIPGHSAGDERSQKLNVLQETSRHSPTELDEDLPVQAVFAMGLPLWSQDKELEMKDPRNLMYFKKLEDTLHQWVVQLDEDLPTQAKLLGVL